MRQAVIFDDLPEDFCLGDPGIHTHPWEGPRTERADGARSTRWYAGAVSRAGLFAVARFAVALVAAAGASAGAEPRRRLEAVQLGVAYHEQRVFQADSFGTSPTLTLEAGGFVSAEVGLTALVRGQHYRGRVPELGESVPRTEGLAGVRVYLQPTPARLLVAAGAGLLVTRTRVPLDSGFGYTTHVFVEVYAGWAVLRSRCTALELGAHAGYSPDEEYVWAGLALGVRRSAW